MIKNSMTKSVLAMAIGLASSGLMAQNELEEVVVTAQNREQSVQDVPIAMDVVDNAAIVRAGFSDMNQIDKIAPIVQVNQDQGAVKITMRGIGTNSNDEAQDTSVVVNVDGEYINRPNIMSSSIFDIERVEVLRGPQGTLYGRNSTGGAINFITNKPGDEFGGNISASYGNYNAMRIDAGIDIPMGETAAVRLSGFYDDRDGYVDHPSSPGFGPFPAFAGGESDDNEAQGFRVSLRFEPTDALSINLAAETSEREYTPQTFGFTDLNAPGNAPTGPGCNHPGYDRVAPAYEETLCVPSSTSFVPNSDDRDEFAAPVYGLGLVQEESDAFRGRITYEFSEAATLSYIAGFRTFEGDDSNLRTLPVVYRSYSFQDEADTQSHELRLNGEIGGIIYQVGAFYFKEELDRESGFLLPIGPNGTFLSYFGRYVESESKSVFGQVEVPLSETLTAVGGLRYTENDRDAVYLNAAPFGAMGPDFYLFNAGPDRKDFNQMAYLSTLNLNPPSEDETTWLIGLNYTPDDETLIYGKVSTGFKAGGFDSVGPYDPETNLAYELGWKQAFGDSGEHTFNLSAFFYDYQDLQVSVLLDTSIGGQTFNAGEAEIWGLEGTFEFNLTSNDHLMVSVNYLDAEYQELFAQFNVFCLGCDLNGIGDLDPNEPGVQQPNFAGNTPPFSPEWIIVAAYDHEFDLGSVGTLTATISTTYKSSYYTDFYNYDDSEQDDYTQTDIMLEYRPHDESFMIQAYAQNLEDERPLTYGSFVSAGPDDIYNWQYGRPMTYGVRVGYNF